MKYVVDTSTLLRIPGVVSKYDCVITAPVLRELEKHKLAKDEGLRYQAREATRVLIDSDVDVDLKDYTFSLNDEFDPQYNDNKLLQACINNGHGLITDDLLLRIKAKGLGVPVIIPEEQELYTGYMDVCLSDEELANLYSNLRHNKYNLLTNQYLIIRNSCGEIIQKYRWDGKEHVDLKLPPRKYVKVLNGYQECALDLLNNKDIPIKIIAGVAGSGKTYMNIRMGMYLTFEKGFYNKILIVRPPVGASNGSGDNGLGFLPGDKWNKMADFFKPIYDQLDDGGRLLQEKSQQGLIEFDVPYYMKGTSKNASQWVMVDEAEDLNVKTLSLIGTRIGEGSCIVMSGDIDQAENKFKDNNGLGTFINLRKGNPLVGVVVLKENVRSATSNLFMGL